MRDYHNLHNSLWILLLITLLIVWTFIIVLYDAEVTGKADELNDLECRLFKKSTCPPNYPVEKERKGSLLLCCQEAVVCGDGKKSPREKCDSSAHNSSCSKGKHCVSCRCEKEPEKPPELKFIYEEGKFKQGLKLMAGDVRVRVPEDLAASISFLVFDDERCRNRSCEQGPFLYDESLCQTVQSAWFDIFDDAQQLVVRIPLKKQGCIFSVPLSEENQGKEVKNRFFLNKKYVGKSMKGRLTVAGARRLRETRDLTIHVIPDTLGPIALKGLHNIFTTLPVNFNVLVKDNYEVKDADVIVVTNKKTYEISLERNKKIDFTSFLFKGVWTPEQDTEIIREVLFRSTDVNGNGGNPYRIVPEPEIFHNDFTCTELWKSGPLKEKINTVFITSNFSHEDSANADFASLHQKLFTYAPFREHSDKFNFFVISSDVSVLLGFEDIFSLIKNECGIDVEQVHQIHTLIKRIGGSYAAPGRGSVISVPRPQLFVHPSIFVHEWGHSFGFLADEYVQGSFYKNFYPVNNDNTIRVNIDNEGCQKWCSGVLNTQSEYFSYYDGWKTCVLPYVPNASAEENDAPLLECWNFWRNKLSTDLYGVPPQKPLELIERIDIKEQANPGDEFTLNSLPLGKDCLPEAECVFTAEDGVGKFRSTRHSIMEGFFGGIYDRYGIVSEQHLRKLLNKDKRSRVVLNSLAYTAGELSLGYTTTEPSAFFTTPSVIFVDSLSSDGHSLEGFTIDLEQMSQKQLAILSEFSQTKQQQTSASPTALTKGTFDIVGNENIIIEAYGALRNNKEFVKK